MPASLIILLREPFRLFFPAGAVGAVVAMALWGTWLGLLGQGRAPAIAALPPGWLHGHTLIWGVFALFIFGFALTALPRQTNQPRAVPPRRWLALLAVLLGGQLLLVVGVLRAEVVWAAGGGALGGLAILAAATGMARWLPTAGNPHQPRYAVAALALLGAAALVDVSAWPDLAVARHQWALRAGLYAQVLLVLAFAHRLVPFFAGRAIPGYGGVQGRYFLPIAAAAIALRLGLTAAPGLTAWAGAVDAGLAVWVLREWWRWSPATAVRQWLVGVKLVPVAWIGVGLVLSAAHSWGLAWPDAGRAWIHALGVGGISAMILAFSTRVSLGHGGRPLEPDRWLRLAFWLVQAAAVLRLLLPVWTWAAGGGMMAATHWAAWPWAAAFILWLARLLPLMGRHS